MPNGPTRAAISKVGRGSCEVSAHWASIELKGYKFCTQLSEPHQRENMDVVLTVVESLDAILANPIVLLTRTEERYGWDLEQYPH